MNTVRWLTLSAVACVLLTQARAQTPTPTELGKKLGFTEAEIEAVKGGEIVTKDLKEGSDKELAGVLLMMFKAPLAELVDIAIQGKKLASDPTVRAYREWKEDASADEVFAEVGLNEKENEEAGIFSRASPGGKLNLSEAEIGRFKGLKTEQINAELRAMLKARYQAYRQDGLKGIVPYARDDKKTASPAEELALAINAVMPVVQRKDSLEALLNYPANPVPDVEHRFFWFKQTVENRPTFILAHRAKGHVADAALLTEEQYYVGHSYNSNLIAIGALTVEGGTLVFYINRSFTDQVSGFMSGMKHGVGRKQMLAETAANLKRIREQVDK